MSSTAGNNVPVKSKPAASSSRLLVAVVVILVVVAAAIAIPVGIVFGSKKYSIQVPPFAPPPSPPPQYSIRVAITTSGDVSDYTTTQKNSILSTLATAAGFSTAPTGATIALSSASVRFVADFPVEDMTAMSTAKAALQQAIPDQASAQVLLRQTVPGIIVEVAPVVDAMDGSQYPPPPPFALVGHWMSEWGSGMTFTNEHQITISAWTKELAPITQYTDTYYIIQKPSTDTYNPKKFQKIFYHTNSDGSVSTCTSLSDGATEDHALAHNGTGIYSTTKCGSFSPTKMTRYTIPVAGSWMVGTQELTISNDQWKSNASWGVTDHTIHAFGASMAIAQMPADDTYNPSKWVKFEWHDKTSTGFSYCMTIYNADTLVHALEYDSVGLGKYNTSEHEPKGCGGSFSHSAATQA